MTEYKHCNYSLRKAIKQVKCQYRDKVCGRDYRQSDYKKKTSHVKDTDITLPDKLNTFFARFEDNTV